MAKKKAQTEQEPSGDREIAPGFSVSVGDRSYRAGQEDALAEVLDKKEAARLMEKGVLRGSW